MLSIQHPLTAHTSWHHAHPPHAVLVPVCDQRPSSTATASVFQPHASVSCHTRGPASRRGLKLPSSLSPHAASSPVVALDVEYCHLQLSDGSRTSAAAYVCVVHMGAQGKPEPLLKSYTVPEALTTLIRPSGAATAITEHGRDETMDSMGASGSPTGQLPVTRPIGGVRTSHLRCAPPLSEVAGQVVQLCQGRLLVGHGLSKDLSALGIADAVERQWCYDTITFPDFQARDGSARTLKHLAKRHLGLDIQVRGRHDPEEDAAAVLLLYLQHVRPRLAGSYEELVEVYTQQLLAQMQQGGRATGSNELLG